MEKLFLLLIIVIIQILLTSCSTNKANKSPDEIVIYKKEAFMRKLLLPALVFVLLFSGCQGKTVQTSKGISLTDIESITIKALPSPPKIKTIDKEDDIKKIINHINSINKGKTKQEDINGWEFYVQTKGKKEHSIMLIGNLIKIDGVWYKINADEIKKFRELYSSLYYKEESI